MARFLIREVFAGSMLVPERIREGRITKVPSARDNDPSKPLKDLRRSWAKALKDAGMEYFWLYDLRHTLASRLSQAGVSPVFVAQIIGHSSTSILSDLPPASAHLGIRQNPCSPSPV
jgi:integrase